MRRLTLIITNKSQLILCQRTRHSSLQIRYLHTICAFSGICERKCNFLFSNLSKFTFKKKRCYILFPLSSSTRQLGPQPKLIGLTGLQVASLYTLVHFTLYKLKQLQNYFSIVFLYFIEMLHFEPTLEMLHPSNLKDIIHYFDYAKNYWQ